jgi:hypothetical protein
VAIPTGVLPLADWAKFTNDPLVQKITQSMYEQENVYTLIPFMQKKRTKISIKRWTDNLPRVDFVPANTDPPVSTGTPEDAQESVSIVRNIIPIDHIFLEDEGNIGDPLGQQMEAYIWNWTYKANYSFIKNGTTTLNDPHAPLGLQWRLDNPAQSGVQSELKVSAGGLSFTGSMTQANALAFAEYFETVLSYMNAKSGENVIAFMNDQMKRRIKTAIALMGDSAGFSSGRDNYDRLVETWRGVRMVDIGRSSAGGGPTGNIITSTENAAGTSDTGSTHSSIYFVKVGENAFHWWHFDPMRAIRNGINDDGIIKQITMEYVFGLAQHNTYSIARLHGLAMS